MRTRRSDRIGSALVSVMMMCRYRSRLIEGMYAAGVRYRRGPADQPSQLIPAVGRRPRKSSRPRVTLTSVGLVSLDS